MLELLPAGCALFDYDNDGWLDILLLQSGSSEPSPKGQRPHCALYRNDGTGGFTDATAGSGLDRDLGYAHGVACGDFDNDGFEDLFITAFGGNHLLRNEQGTGRFADVTARMGLGRKHSTGYATSAAFGDYDNDGRLDLYVCYYGPWTWQKDLPCTNARGQREYCTPELYEPDTHRLYRNAGNRFVDVSSTAGITRAKGRGLAVAWLDYDDDGRQDIYVANDLTPAMLWRNNGDGTFTDRALSAGCAYDMWGRVMAGMGIALADYDHSGRESLFVTNFSGKPNMLFRNVGGGFQDASLSAGLAMPHMNFLAFGCEFLDYDLDGWRDLIVANGHVQVHVESQSVGVAYRQRKQLFRNGGRGVFTEVTDPDALGELGVPTVSRGLAVGDADNDGRPDVLVCSQNDRAQLFRCQAPSAGAWVSFRAVGTRSPRSGVHARFVLEAGGQRQAATVRGGSSYLSHSDRRVHFGLGSAKRVERVEVLWPSGTRDVLRNLAPNAVYTVAEGRGVTHVLRPGPPHP